MGQQQLLLLVLSTVIVGLATVAGIEAFSQGQRQATQDALVQRAVSIGTDILAAHNKPSQLGGIDLESEPDDDVMAAAAGFDSNGFGADIPADGAGDSAVCDIDGDTNTALVHCASESSSRGSPRGLVVTVRIDPNLEEGEEKVEYVEVNRDVGGKGDLP
jgi:hypothetical protein